MAEKIQLTREAYDALKIKLEHLEGEARTKVIEEIARARAHGDLSENAEYHAAKDQQGMQEAEARKIRHMLENSEIIEAADDGIAGPGKLITIRLPGEEAETYFLGILEEPGDVDALTPESPLGRAIVGRSRGETVEAEVPAGKMTIEIIDVKPGR